MLVHEKGGCSKLGGDDAPEKALSRGVVQGGEVTSEIRRLCHKEVA
jgi:hypothetical protein